LKFRFASPIRIKYCQLIKLQSENGFLTTDNIRLECDISHDKLIHFRAYIKDLKVLVEPLNPFSNDALSVEDIAEKKLMKVLNQATKNNGGKPPVKLLEELAKFYVRLEKHLKAAEMFETIQMLEPFSRYETSICYHYSCAGKNKLSDKWAEIAYNKNPNGTNAYNLALVKEQERDTETYQKLMEEAVNKDCEASYLAYGEFLLVKDNDRAKQLFQKGFDIWYRQFQSGTLHKNSYSRLIKAARQVGELEIAEKVKIAQEKLNKNHQLHWYNSDNLATNTKNYLPPI
jgi:molecular chaperone DnaK